MDKIAITDNREEQIKIGKEIFESKPDEYSPNRLRSMYSDLRRILPGANEDMLQDAFFHAVYDYWVYGNNIREEFFYKFYELPHAEKVKYITFRNRFYYYGYLNDKTDERIFREKYLTYTHFRESFNRDVIMIQSEDDYEKFCQFIRKHPSFFVKPGNLGLALGIHKANINDCNSERELFNKLCEEGRESGKVSWSLNSAIILEEPIVQRKEMASLHPASVNVIRLTTILVDDKVVIVDAWLRVGMNGYEVAGASMGEIYCGVDIKTGVVETDGYTEFGDVFSKHPTTNIKFKGYQIPCWQEMIGLSIKLAKKILTVRYVGWDLALTDEGWVVVEGNENGEFLGQLIYGIPYKNKIERMINYYPNKEFWWN